MCSFSEYLKDARRFSVGPYSDEDNHQARPGFLSRNSLAEEVLEKERRKSSSKHRFKEEAKEERAKSNYPQQSKETSDVRACRSQYADRNSEQDSLLAKKSTELLLATQFACVGESFDNKNTSRRKQTPSSSQEPVINFEGRKKIYRNSKQEKLTSTQIVHNVYTQNRLFNSTRSTSVTSLNHSKDFREDSQSLSFVDKIKTSEGKVEGLPKLSLYREVLDKSISEFTSSKCETDSSKTLWEAIRHRLIEAKGKF